MTDTAHRDRPDYGTAQQLPYEPVPDPNLWVPIGYNPRHDGESWLRWKVREFLGRA